jgi:hypothetical protein
MWGFFCKHSNHNLPLACRQNSALFAGPSPPGSGPPSRRPKNSNYHNNNIRTREWMFYGFMATGPASILGLRLHRGRQAAILAPTGAGRSSSASPFIEKDTQTGSSSL